MKSSGEQVEEHLEQLWSDDRVVQQAAKQKLIDDGYSMLAYHECQQRQMIDAGFDNSYEYEEYWRRMDQYYSCMTSEHNL